MIILLNSQRAEAQYPRVLQDGSEDLENDHGSWPLQNIQMTNSLKMREYDFHFSWGGGSHKRGAWECRAAGRTHLAVARLRSAKTEQVYAMDPGGKDKADVSRKDLQPLSRPYGERAAARRPIGFFPP